MNRIFLLSSVFFTLFLIDNNLSAQTITHGPLIGGVTSNSARITMRTVVPFSYQIQVADNIFFTSQKVFYGQTANQNYLFSTQDITGLNPNTKYYYRILIGGNIVSTPHHFYTFPCPGQTTDFSFHFGSCMNNNIQDDVLFDVMKQYDPRFFLHLGDWLYPDTTENLPNNTDFYANDYDLIVGAYKGRYSYPRMREYLKNVPIAYVYDDHDFVADNSSGTTASYTNFSLSPVLMEIPFPDHARTDLIEAYYRFFPAYPPVDSSEGIFHVFRFGNTEIYMIDNRSARSPNTQSLKNINGNWVFAPDPDHTMLGDIQRKWLLKNLKESTATWKFIGSGTAFNRTYGNALQSALNLPSLAGLPIAALLVDSWSGFPLDQDTLINWVNQHNIDGVIMMSGDTHTAAIGDKQTGGLPEMMAGCLSQSNSTLYTTVPLVNLGLVWSEGGQGIDGNLNTNKAFGNVEVFGDDSVRLSLIDEQNSIIADYIIHSCSFLSGLKMEVDSVEHLLCGDISDGKIHLNVLGGTPPYQFTINRLEWGSEQLLTDIPAGKHLVAVRDANGCTLEACVVIESPEPISITENVTDVTCAGLNNGSVELSYLGGVSPLQLVWSDGSSDKIKTDLSGGDYSYLVIDQNGCIKASVLQIHEPDTLNINMNAFSPDCTGDVNGRIFVSLSGGTAPFHFEWSNGSSQQNLQNLSAGEYALTVTDKHGCAQEKVVDITDPPVLEIHVDKTLPGQGLSDGMIIINPTGGSPPYSFLWNTGESESIISNLPSGFYQVVVLDSRGCEEVVDVYLPISTSISENIKESLLWQIFPNPANEMISIAFNGNFKQAVKIEIFNISGQSVHAKDLFIENEVFYSVSLEEWPAGIYYLRIETGDEYAGKRFLKQ